MPKKRRKTSVFARPGRIDRAGQQDATHWHALEAEAAVIGLVTDEDHEPVALRARGVQRLPDEALADAA